MAARPIRSAVVRVRILIVVVAGSLAVACGGSGAGDDFTAATVRTTTTLAEPTSTTQPPATTAPAPTTTTLARPTWLGTRVLPVAANGYGEVRPTPPELDPRRLPTVDLLPPPADGAFHSQIQPVPEDVAGRSTWQPGCPVDLAELRYVTVSFWGFDDRVHTGELIVHRDSADALVTAFQRLFDTRFPIEEMRITARPELDAPPTGDGNNTAAFVCRPTRGSTNWSQHAYGRAVDVNPFHNPYTKDEVVLPELASTYLARADARPGMVLAGSDVVAAFSAIGWEWGGAWESPNDPMHFSANGR